VVICLERGADLHMAQLMPLPLTVSCFSKVEIGFTFLVPGSSGQRAVKWVRVYIYYKQQRVCRPLKASSHRHARHDKTVLSVSRPLRRCELDSRDNSGLSPTENLKSEHVHSNRPIHTSTRGTTQTGPSCRVWCDGLN